MQGPWGSKGTGTVRPAGLQFSHACLQSHTTRAEAEEGVELAEHPSVDSLSLPLLAVDHKSKAPGTGHSQHSVRTTEVRRVVLDTTCWAVRMMIRVLLVLLGTVFHAMPVGRQRNNKIVNSMTKRERVGDGNLHTSARLLMEAACPVVCHWRALATPLRGKRQENRTAPRPLGKTRDGFRRKIYLC